jgi:hypothetical protein
MKALTLLGVVIILYACSSPAGTMKIASPAFGDGAMIPSEYTCDGPDVIPLLEIRDVPPLAKSLALVMDDPDAVRGVWDHWVVWNIPPSTKEISAQPQGVAGKNSRGDNAYHGPCPPSGTHRYYFKLYALDSMLDLPEGSTKQALGEAMKGHVLAEATLMGRYARKN